MTPEPLKIISLLQPWASAIPLGLKSFETRSWKTPWRGRIAIHASKGWTRQQSEYFYGFPTMREAFREIGVNDHRSLPLGRIVATARIAEVLETGNMQTGPGPYDWQISDRERAFGDYTPGRYAWKLEDIKAVDGPYLKGRLGLWLATDGLAKAIDECRHEYPCTECGGDAFVGMSNWRDQANKQVIGANERLCPACSRRRGISNPLSK